MQRHDDIIISAKSLFRKLFSFYTLIISYKPTPGHNNLVITTKSKFRIILNFYTLQKLRRKISKIQVLRQHLRFWILTHRGFRKSS